VEVSQGDQKRLLDGVFGLWPMTEPMHGDREQQCPVALEQDAQVGGITGPCFLYQRRVIRLAHPYRCG
jgi:hypothetical protein